MYVQTVFGVIVEIQIIVLELIDLYEISSIICIDYFLYNPYLDFGWTQRYDECISGPTDPTGKEI